MGGKKRRKRKGAHVHARPVSVGKKEILRLWRWQKGKKKELCGGGGELFSRWLGPGKDQSGERGGGGWEIFFPGEGGVAKAAGGRRVLGGVRAGSGKEGEGGGMACTRGSRGVKGETGKVLVLQEGKKRGRDADWSAKGRKGGAARGQVGGAKRRNGSLKQKKRGRKGKKVAQRTRNPV